jgi:hypothetical protein
MTESKLKSVRPRLEALVDRDLLKALVKEALDQVLQAQMTEFLGAAPGARSGSRQGYRAASYSFRRQRSRWMYCPSISGTIRVTPRSLTKKVFRSCSGSKPT